MQRSIAFKVGNVLRGSGFEIVLCCYNFLILHYWKKNPNRENYFSMQKNWAEANLHFFLIIDWKWCQNRRGRLPHIFMPKLQWKSLFASWIFAKTMLKIIANSIKSGFCWNISYFIYGSGRLHWKSGLFEYSKNSRGI